MVSSFGFDEISLPRDENTGLDQHRKLNGMELTEPNNQWEYDNDALWAALVEIKTERNKLKDWFIVTFRQLLAT